MGNHEFIANICLQHLGSFLDNLEHEHAKAFKNMLGLATLLVLDDGVNQGDLLRSYIIYPCNLRLKALVDYINHHFPNSFSSTFFFPENFT